MIADRVSSIMRQQRYWAFHMGSSTPQGQTERVLQQCKHQDFKTPKNTCTNPSRYCLFQFQVKWSSCMSSPDKHSRWTQPTFARYPAPICKMALNAGKRVALWAGISNFVCKALIFPSESFKKTLQWKSAWQSFHLFLAGLASQVWSTQSFALFFFLVPK